MDGFDFKKLNHEVDDLLSDVKNLLGGEDSAADAAERAEGAAAPDVPEPDTQLPADEGVRSADDIHIDYAKFYGEAPGEPDGGSEDAVVFQPLTAY